MPLNFGNYDPVDVAADRIGNQETIFVSLTSRVSAAAQKSQTDTLSKLVQYSPEGKEIRTWPLPGQAPYTIALNASDQIVYLGNVRTSEIYTVDLKDSKKPIPTRLLYVSGLLSMGALAVDVQRKRLFVSEAVGGKLYVVDLARRKARAMVVSLGEPTGLAYDASEQKLYVADAGGRRVWMLRPNAFPVKPVVLSKAPEFREPRGLAVDARHQVWVADYGARAVFSLSSKGQVARTYRD